MNRVGRKNKAQFRIVVQEHATAPSGRHIAIVGSYDPHTKAIILKADEIKKYIANGAQPSDTVYNLLVREGVIDTPKRSVKMPDQEVEEGSEEKTAEKETSATEKNETSVDKGEKAAPAEKEEDAPVEKKSTPADASTDKKEKESPAEKKTDDKKETK